MHPQTYGFQAFFPGDKIAFVHWKTLTVFGNAIVTEVKMKSPREILLTLDRPAREDIQPKDVVANVTWTPKVVIRGNYFQRIPTRAILVTTRRKVVIENNVFFRPQMSAILIADDARNWYESGMVKDVVIRGNRFIKTGNPVILVHPENPVVNPRNPVHRNIRVKNNTFVMPEGMRVSVKSTRGFSFVGNKIISEEVHFSFTGSSRVTIAENTYKCKNVEKTISINQSLRNTFDIPKDFQVIN